MASGFGDGTGGSGFGSANVGGSQVISPLAIPQLLQLFQRVQQQTPTRGEMPSLQSIVQAGSQSPLLQEILGPALQRLQAPQAAQRTQLTEAARASGGLRSSQYGNQFNELLNTQGQQVNDLMAQVIQSMLAPLISGQLQEQRNQFLPAETLTNLLRASAPSVARGGASASSGWENIPPSLGLGTPMSGSTMGPAGGVQQTGGFYNNATVGPNAPAAGSGVAPGSVGQPYTPYLDPLGGGGGGGGSLADFLSGISNQQTYGEWEPYNPAEEVSFF